MHSLRHFVRFVPSFNEQVRLRRPLKRPRSPHQTRQSPAMPNCKQLLPNLAGRMRLRPVLSLGLSSTKRLFGCCACPAVGERSVISQSQLLSVCVNIYKFLVCRQPFHLSYSHLTFAFKGCLVTSPTFRLPDPLIKQRPLINVYLLQR
jgi:hypothetical protein